MSESVYVVIAESGEYSDMYYEPILAFTDEGKAKAAITKLDEQRRLYDVWHNTCMTKLGSYGLRYDTSSEVRTAKWKAAEEAAGPKPVMDFPYERFAISVVPLVKTTLGTLGETAEQTKAEKP